MSYVLKTINFLTGGEIERSAKKEIKKTVDHSMAASVHLTSLINDLNTTKDDQKIVKMLLDTMPKVIDNLKQAGNRAELYPAGIGHWNVKYDPTKNKFLLTDKSE